MSLCKKCKTPLKKSKYGTVYCPNCFGKKNPRDKGSGA